MTEFASKINVVLLKVPPGYTSVASPPDVSWNKPLKQRLRKQWVARLVGEVLNSNREDKSAPIPAPSRATVLQWCHTAWTSLTRTTIINGFVKSGWIDRMDLEDESESTTDDIPLATFELLKEASLLDKNIGEISESTCEFDSGKTEIEE